MCECVCLCVCTPARANLWKCSLEAVRSLSLSLSVSSNTSVSIFCVQRSAFSATTRCTVQSVSLTKHDQDNKKKIINANLPNSAFVSVRGSVFFYGLLFCFCLCVNVTRLTLLSLCCTVLNGPYLSFFLFCFINCEFFLLF